MTEARQLRVFRWDYFLLAALSLSIGWGIRGNFGHEYGAMIPGCLTAIAVCLMSGRQDWRERAAYFAAFGALGWGFGGSISYMQVIAYSHSGVAESQLYGFAGLFLIGFLWAGMGGAGTAFPAVADREQLTAIFKPLCWIFALWLFKAWVVWPIAERWSTDYTATLNRHESPLYWFDADWTEAVTALIAVCLYDLYDRRFHKRVHPQVSLILGLVLAGFAIYLYFFIPVATDMHVLGIHFQFRGETFLMPFSYMRADLAMLAAILIALAFAVSVLYPLMLVFAGGGALLGQIAQQWIATKPELQDRLVGVLIHRQGDSEVYREVAGLTDKSLEEVSANFMLNWPQFFEEFHHYGLLFGAIIGAAIYFIWRGRFRDGASLFVYMSAGWLLSFILFPTILGLRLTPPRSDDWAGILGVFLGTNIWLIRNKLLPVAWAAWVSGILGGLAFAGAACLKLVMVYVGNPNRPGLSPEAIEFWKHWQSANWHSFLEQSYGFFNGLAIAVALGLLAKRVGKAQGAQTQRRWTQVLAVSFVLFLLLYVNIYKNVAVWVNEGKTVPVEMRVPLLPVIPTESGELFKFPAAAWFNSVWIALTIAGIYLMVRHLRRPVALLPESWLGRGQLLYLVFLWAMVIANFERALTGFAEQRLITEWVILINAVIVTVLILARPAPEGIEISGTGETRYAGRLVSTILLGLLSAAAVLVIMTGIVRGLYGDTFAGHSGQMVRFGPNAEWRIHPIVKGGEHR